MRPALDSAGGRKQDRADTSPPASPNRTSTLLRDEAHAAHRLAALCAGAHPRPRQRHRHSCGLTPGDATWGGATNAATGAPDATVDVT